MGIKNLCRAWKKGKKCFKSVYGVKDAYARDLLTLGCIYLPKNEKAKAKALKNPSKYLESKGWKWESINTRCPCCNRNYAPWS